jgi:hypothetical protein
MNYIKIKMVKSDYDESFLIRFIFPYTSPYERGVMEEK